MNKIIVLGAGQSSPFLIQDLLRHAGDQGWSLTVADRDRSLAESRVAGHPAGRVIELDMTDTLALGDQVKAHDVIVSLMPPKFQPLIGWACVQHGRHMVTASYRDESLRELDGDAQTKGILLLPEVGLDPGFDLMSAVEMIERVKAAGGVIESFESYGAGVLGPDSKANPLRYGITWNPRNVVMAAEFGAAYMETGKVKLVPWHHVFRHTWPIEVEGVGTLEGYPNRDSLQYKETLGLDDAHTVIRGTLRYPGWSELWSQIVRLGMPNEQLTVPNLGSYTWRQLVEMFLPRAAVGTKLESRVANYLNISRTGGIMDKLAWLGLFDDKAIGGESETVAEALVELLRRKLELPKTEPDLVILKHEFEIRYPDEGDRREFIESTFTHYGDPGGMTAMARTVGMPAAIAVRLLMAGRIALRGSHLPTHPEIYRPVLDELAREGLAFSEKVTKLEKEHVPVPHRTPYDTGQF